MEVVLINQHYYYY